jgi:plasmid stabilization system protein ParE
VIRLIVSPRAKRDLAAIGDYIAKDNPRAAPEFIRKIRSKCALLQITPWMGRECHDIAPMFVRSPTALILSSTGSGKTVMKWKYCAFGTAGGWRPT